VWTVHYVVGGPSLKELQAIAGRVPTTEPFSSTARDLLIDWGVDPIANRVVIRVSSVLPTLVQDVRTAFGDLAEIRTTDSRPTLHYYRLHDGPPLSGSDRITSTDNVECTAGFEAYKIVSGVYHYGMLTAGHCWGTGTTIYNGYLDCHNGRHTYAVFGKVTARVWGNNVTDAEFIDATAVGQSVNPNLWWGPQTNPVPGPAGTGCPPETTSSGPVWITGSGTNYVGRSVCFDGSFSGEKCGGTIAALDQCVQFFGGYYECHLNRVDGQNFAQEGDSGAPVEKTNGLGTGVIVFGTDVGGDPGFDEYYADITAELNALGAGLIVH